jgi:glucose 1-dehydrogenase
VANAGLQRDSAFTKMSLADWQLVLNVNLTGQFLCARRERQIVSPWETE